ncbi:hypothetical protein CEP54_011247 [Fusarium duplospermum]|uniref:Uncharacterized protein n=1 Tax=Fusarium duplospermum TaxID=1325734 RepID=A0A428PFI6_9HYPO|nr:hypothetical protein CEP54_011247 [Fusarium duplospermum]
MRLLNTQTIVVESFGDDQIPSYAILSHTWEAEEVTFQDMESGKATRKRGWAKVKDSCSIARKNGFDYVWLDTCCIDKTSSAELSEAINSMYRWYQEATVCYAFLADVSGLAGLPNSKWFTRGWTLQELIAPSSMIFFSQTWDELGTKATLNQAISKRTRIPEAILSGDKDLETASAAQRMSWAADRRTTRREDLAYCLMGIFSINMPLLYGEGETAFIRLQEEIMRVSDDHSLFAWKYPNSRGGLLAASPAAFKDSGNIIPWNPFKPYNSPFTLTNKGAHLDLPFIGLGDRGTGLAVLSCTEVGDPDKLVAIYLRDSFLTMEHFERCRSEQFDLIDLSKFRPAQYPTRSLCIRLRGLSQRPKGASNGEIQHDQSRLSDEAPNDKEGETEQDEQKQLSIFAAQGRESEVKRLLALPNVQADFGDDEGRTPLSLAAKAGHEGIVKLLLDRRDVDVNSGGNSSPIASAIEGGHEGVVWQLLARTDTSSSPGQLLSIAASSGHEALLSQLLTRKDIQEHLTAENFASLFSDAAAHGHESVIRLLLGLGKVHPDQEDDLGHTALWWATTKGHEGVVKMLLETGWVDPCRKDKDGMAALYYAVSKGYTKIVRLLLQHGTDIEVTGWPGASHLLEASAQGYVSIVEDLLAHGAKTEPKYRRTRTALMAAASIGHEVIVRMLLEGGADVNYKGRIGSQPPTYRSPLDCACDFGHEGVVKLLLDHGATVDDFKRTAKSSSCDIVKLLLDNSPPSRSRDVDIRAVLHEAIEKRDSNLARVLLEAAEDTQSVIRPFHLVAATLNRDKDMAKVLLDRGANPNSQWNGDLLLGFATLQKCEEVVEVLLSGPAKRDKKAVLAEMEKTSNLDYSVSQDEAGIVESETGSTVSPWCTLTPLWCATVSGHETMVKLLLEHGADTNIAVQTMERSRRTVLYDAARLNHEGIVKLLLSSGASPNVGGSLWSPLLQASSLATHDNVAMAQMLLESGAYTEVGAHHDETPLLHAAQSRNVALVELLLKHGAKCETIGLWGRVAESLASKEDISELLC